MHRALRELRFTNIIFQMQSPLVSQSGWSSLDSFEMRIVRHFCGWRKIRSVSAGAHLVNVLADGWVYVPIAGGLYFIVGQTIWSVMAEVVLSVVIAHIIHAYLKRRFKRIRPFERDAALLTRTRALDRYSFPSGHCMTFVCVAVPIGHSAPAIWPGALAFIGVLAVSRLIAAHHYPSDVLAGISIGLAVATALSGRFAA